jgi:hypothetical protein
MRTAGLARRLLGLRGMFGSPENLARTRSSSHSYESAKTKVSRAQCLTSPDCIRVSAARWGALRLAPTNPAEVSVAAVCAASQRRPRSMRYAPAFSPRNRRGPLLFYELSTRQRRQAFRAAPFSSPSTAQIQASRSRSTQRVERRGRRRGSRSAPVGSRRPTFPAKIALFCRARASIGSTKSDAAPAAPSETDSAAPLRW